jgi:hypothetical protein
MLLRGIGFATLALSLLGCATEVPNCGGCDSEALHLNDIVTVGTHNSYKQAIDPKLFAAMLAKEPRLVPALDYSHASLVDQLNDGARAVEIDIVYDPNGGLFSHPRGPALVGLPLPAGFSDAMSKPGFKVLHMQDFDFRSSCATLRDCLVILKAWSRAHTNHVPILLTFNAKDDSLPEQTRALKFDEAAFDALDAEIRSVLDPSDLITPDDVQGTYPTLRDAVLHHGWPTLASARGKFILALDEEGEKIALYRGNRTSLEGRVMFVNAPENSPVAAYLTLNEALIDAAHITEDVKRGFLVRTRADADTIEARSNDTRRRDAALASGAQYVSTDYMQPDSRFSAYATRMPQGVVAACNPVRAAGKCSQPLE